MSPKKPLNEYTTKEYLDYVRIIYEDQEMRNVTPKESKDLLRLISNITEKIPNQQNKFINELENYIFDSIDIDLIDHNKYMSADGYIKKEALQILQSADTNTKDYIEKNVIFGTLLIPEINGMCIKAPSGKYIICVPIGTLGYCQLLAKLLTNCINIKLEGSLLNPIFNYQEVSQFLYKVISNFPNLPAGSDDFYSKLRVNFENVNSQNENFCNTLGDYLVRFIIAHEIAHFILGHMEHSNLRKLEVSGKTAEIVFNTYHHELQADLLASILIDAHIQNKEKSEISKLAASISIPIFLSMVELLEEIKGLSSLDHPPGKKRRLAWEENMSGTKIDSVWKVLQKEVFNKVQYLHKIKSIAIQKAQLGNDYSSRGQYQNAITEHEIVLKYAKELDDYNLIAQCLLATADNSIQIEDFNRSIECFNEALNIVKLINGFDNIDNIYNQLALAHTKLGAYSDAVNCLKKAIDIVRNNGESEWEGKYLFSLGKVYGMMGNLHKSIECFDIAIDILTPILGSKDPTVESLIEIAMLVRSKV